MSKRAAVCVCAIVVCMLAVAVSGCGSSAIINPDDLIAATFSEGASSSAGGAGYELDLASSGMLRNRMNQARLR
jgi:predicted amidohydrolase